MKRWPMVLMTAGVMVMSQAEPAQAINKEWSAALGFVGGVLVANNHHYRQQYNNCRTAPAYYQPVVYTAPPCPPPVIVRESRPSGHWEYREQQEWVPGSWKYEEIGCNTYRKTWCPGYYRTSTVKVWVEDCDRRYTYRD